MVVSYYADDPLCHCGQVFCVWPGGVRINPPDGEVTRTNEMRACRYRMGYGETKLIQNQSTKKKQKNDSKLARFLLKWRFLQSVLAGGDCEKVS